MTARPMMLDQALPLGTRLGGCTVDAVLAADECGFVYRMTDSLLLGRVAIKEYFPQALAERSGTDVRPRSPADQPGFDAGLLAFAEEARLLTRLQHPGLVRVLDSFEAHQTVYQVMPLIDGSTLEHARRSSDEPPDVAWLRELMLALLEPVDALHAAGLVHGDIQPAKVMLRAEDKPLLMGFGSVRRALHATPDTAYAPLEQTPIGGHLPRGAWTDLYAVGAVTWFAATGRPPAPSTERSAGALFLPAAAMEAALEADRGDARDRSQLIAAVDRAMALLPPDRPQSGAELRSLFTAPAPVAAEAPPMAASREDSQWRTLPQLPIATDQTPVRPRSRSRVAVGAWAAALLLTSAAGVLAWRWNDVLQASRSLAAAARSTPAPPELVAAIEPKAAPAQPIQPAETSAPAAPAPAEPAEPAEPAAADLERVPVPAAGPASEPMPAAEPPPAAAPEKRPAVVPPKRVAREPARRPTKPPRPAPRVVTAAAAPAPPVTTPRGACGARENFSLYYCMQTQCRKPQFSAHAQCRHLRETGEVS